MTTKPKRTPGVPMTLRPCGYLRCRRSFPVTLDSPRQFCDDACNQAETRRKKSQARMINWAVTPCACAACQSLRNGGAA